MNERIMTLFELLSLVKSSVRNDFPDSYWITAEISNLKEDFSGKCHLELIEKDETNGQQKAKSNAVIWGNKYPSLKLRFFDATGRCISAGMKVLISVTPSFSEKYGFSCFVNDIDPTFTLGDIEAKRQETIRQIKEDGVWDINHELELSPVLQRIALISSPTAAGYGDFRNHIESDTSGFKFHITLFPAIMQGDNSPASIFKALCAISDSGIEFDAVAIVRGGGANADLLAFDDYELCSACAQYPIPIISGIGHERDNSILDMVANTRCKTPTAVADFILNRMTEQANLIRDIQGKTLSLLQNKTDNTRNTLRLIGVQLTQKTTSQIRVQEQKLRKKEETLHTCVNIKLMKEKHLLNSRASSIPQILQQKLIDERHKLNLIETKIDNLSPENILKRGYTITTKNGKIVKKAEKLKKNDTIITIFADGRKESIVKD